MYFKHILPYQGSILRYQPILVIGDAAMNQLHCELHFKTPQFCNCKSTATLSVSVLTLKKGTL